MLKLVALVMVETLAKFINTHTILVLLEAPASNTSLTTCNMRLLPSMNAKTALGLHHLLERMVKINAGLLATLATTSVTTTM